LNDNLTNKNYFSKEFTQQESIPSVGIEKAVEILKSGRLHRYNTLQNEVSEVSLLEKEFAAYVGSSYCAAMSSCGSSIYVALKSLDVRPGDKILCNAFTLAPVPGAIENAGAKPVFVDITEDYVTDLQDLEEKAKESGANFLLLSHMRGNIVNMDKVVEICNKYDIALIEDCAHTMGATWDGKHTGTFGEVGCFSTQTYKHINSGEGGLLVTNNEDVAAKAILYSGSYMLYEKHISKPDNSVFEKYKRKIPNCSLRMSNLAAALIRAQLPLLDEQCIRWNKRYDILYAGLNNMKHLRLPIRREKEGYVGSSFQFTLQNVNIEQVQNFIDICAQRGVEIKWFGSMDPVGFTSRFESWEYLNITSRLPTTEKILNYMCDFRVPLTFSLIDCEKIVMIIKEVSEEVFNPS